MNTWKVIAERDGERLDLSYDTEQDAALGALGMTVTGYTTRIVEHSETGKPYLPDGYDGPIATCADCGNPAPDVPCKRVHNQPEAPLCGPCRDGQLMVHLFCWHCGGDRFAWKRDSQVEWTTILSFNDEDTPVIDDARWTSDDSGGGRTWVECLLCGHELLQDVDYDIG